MANQLTAIKQEVFDIVEQRVHEYTDRGELVLPAGYSAGNAMKSAWLILQETADTNKRPVLEACTKASIINTLQSMLYQGLNPDKKQCYFIAYGNKLTLQRSYFGSMHVARMLDPTITDDCDCEPIADGCYYINDWQAKIDNGMYGQDYKVDPDTVGQFIGLEDKLGTKIFEGDVIDDLGVEYIVVFDSDYAQFRGKFDGWNAEISHIASRCEVIGNIYDNPELLEVSENEM